MPSRRIGCSLAAGAGRSGLRYKFTVTQHSASAEFYIDWGKDSGTQNEDIFDQLAAHKEQVDASFGEPLNWERLDGSQHCKIRKQVDLGGYLDEDKWPQIHETMVDSVIGLEKSLGPYIDKLKIPVTTVPGDGLQPVPAG